jgi:hypothetical protein
MATTEGQHSRVPSHLRQFHPPRITIGPAPTPRAYSYTTERSPDGPVELCPPHWRLPPKKSLRKKLKALVLKEPATAKRYRRSTMRMKDSDDYLTARAANPRTGRISPSIRSLNVTPEIQGNPFQPPKEQPPSPTPGARPRPLLRRADGPRQISTGSLRRHANGWISDSLPSAASPRQSAATAGAVRAPLRTTHLLKDDQLVHMPSAREPQPYLHPGKTAAEIQAAEAFKINNTAQKCHWQKAIGSCPTFWAGQRVSINNGMGGMEQAAHHETNPPRPPAPQHYHRRPTENAGACRGQTHGAWRVPSNSRGGRTLPMPSDDGNPEPPFAPLDAVTFDFAPFSSPRTPANNGETAGIAAEPEILKTVRVPGAFQDLITSGSTPPQLKIQRKPVPSAPSPRDVATTVLGQEGQDCLRKGCIFDKENNCQFANVKKQSPRVTLAQHPELFNLPQFPGTTTTTSHCAAGSRQCSFGCKKLPETGECLQQSSVASCPDRNPLFEGDGEPEIPSKSEAVTQSTSGQTDSIRANLPFVCQALALTVFVTVAWKLGIAFTLALEALLWPIAVPVKVLGWLAGA